MSFFVWVFREHQGVPWCSSPCTRAKLTLVRRSHTQKTRENKCQFFLKSPLGTPLEAIEFLFFCAKFSFVQRECPRNMAKNNTPKVTLGLAGVNKIFTGDFWAASIRHLMWKTSETFETQIWLEIITSRAAKSACCKGSQYRNNFLRFFAEIWPKMITSRDGCVLLNFVYVFSSPRGMTPKNT